MTHQVSDWNPDREGKILSVHFFPWEEAIKLIWYTVHLRALWTFWNIWKHRDKFSNYYIMRTVNSHPPKTTEFDHNVALTPYLSHWVFQSFWIHTKESKNSSPTPAVDQTYPTKCSSILPARNARSELSHLCCHLWTWAGIKNSFISLQIYLLWSMFTVLHTTTTEIWQCKTDRSEILNLYSREFFSLDFFPENQERVFLNWKTEWSCQNMKDTEASSKV